MFQYTVRKRRGAKYLRLRVVPPGEIIISAPTWLGGEAIEQFLEEKAAWLRAKLSLVKHIPRRRTKREERRDYEEKKETARTLVEECVVRLNQGYRFPVGRITIRNQKTRWGSCSSQGNLSFNYRIVYLSPRERDYIVVHELCHLKEMNHSPRFWALVEKAMPDYLVLRRRLREQGKLLY